MTVVWIGLALFYIASALVTMGRFRPPGDRGQVALPPCSIVVPVRGRSPFLEENLAALAALERLTGEVLVCVADERDAAIEVVAPIAERHRHRMRLLVGEDRAFANPKLRNLAKGYRASREEIVLFLDDSSALDDAMLGDLLGALQSGAALATSAPLACDARNFWAEVEAATWNGNLVRLESLLALLGKAAAFGNAIAFHKASLEAVGGLSRMADGPCEDNALSKALQANGGRLALTRSSVRRRIGRRSLAETWHRHVRWKNCARWHDPVAFAAEPFVGGLAFNVLGTYVLSNALGGFPAALLASMSIWYGTEMLLHVVCRWPVRAVTPLAWLVRDLAHPVFTLAALCTWRVDWRGNSIDMRFVGERRAARRRLPPAARDPTAED
jgi:ceramide glucosyltransferase